MSLLLQARKWNEATTPVGFDDIAKQFPLIDEHKRQPGFHLPPQSGAEHRHILGVNAQAIS